ncbi:hypothetical protein D3C74_399120 [compost metagenome]
MEPTDKSMPPVAMTSVMPMDTRIKGAPKLRISIKLPYRFPSRMTREKKSGEYSKLKIKSKPSIHNGQNK